MFSIWFQKRLLLHLLYGRRFKKYQSPIKVFINVLFLSKEGSLYQGESQFLY